MVVADFLLIAFVVGIVTKTWLGFLGTFFGLYALYRFTRLSAVLSLALSLYWGLLGYHLGAATGQLGVGPLLAVVVFAVAAGVRRAGFLALASQPQSIDPDSLSDDFAAEHQMSSTRRGCSMARPKARSSTRRLLTSGGTVTARPRRFGGRLMDARAALRLHPDRHVVCSSAEARSSLPCARRGAQKHRAWSRVGGRMAAPGHGEMLNWKGGSRTWEGQVAKAR